MRFSLLLIGCLACGSPAPTNVVSIRPLAVPTATSAPVAKPQPPAVAVVVTNAPHGGLALWRPHSDGRFDPIAFPWAKLSNIDTLHVSPDGLLVAYVEGGSAFGPLLVRDLSSGDKTVVAPFVKGHELLVAAWSPNGRKILYADRTTSEIPNCIRGIHGCTRTGPKSFRVYDRDDAKTTPIDLSLGELDEIAALLDTGEVLVTNDDGALERFDPKAKTRTPLASTYRHSGFSIDAHRLLSTGWDEKTMRDDVLALDLATWKETAVAPAAPYATYLVPAASRSGKHIAWLASSYTAHVHSVYLVVDGKPLAGPSGDLVGFEWIDDASIVAHYRNRLDVVDVVDGTVAGSTTTNADDMMR
jgi:hypothetical protein